ncbi:MAG: hypothetical protein N3I35_13200 [Clostridia bacterium]|nr:hypothetical protein [Clostridia bacterium]
MKFKKLLENRKMPHYWSKLGYISLQAFLDSPTCGWTLDKAVSKANELYAEYKCKGCIQSLIYLEALELPEIVGILFFNLLFQDVKLKDGRPESPVADEVSDNWMNHSDYSFLNIRATGKEIDTTGNFIDVVRILPLLRVRALHVAPFFESILGIVYAQNSFSIVSDEVTHMEFEKRGMSRYDQVRYFIDCCHILGISAGVDLVTHTSAFSRVAMDKPYLFRWIRFSPDNNTLYNNETIEQQYTREKQEEMSRHISELCGRILNEEGLDSFEDTNVPIELNRKAYLNALKLLRKNGYFTMIPQTWNGAGAAAFKGFYHEGGYPVWNCCDINGKDQTEHSYGAHAAFMFHYNMMPNQLSFQITGKLGDCKTVPNDEAVSFLSEFFPRMHRTYGFDFLRIDYVDHIYSNLWNENGEEIPICDSLTPAQISEISQKAKECFPAAGVLADHVGNDIWRYRKAGFTIILGSEVGLPISAQNLQWSLKFNPTMEMQNGPSGEGGTVLYPIDTHDMANPFFKGKELPEREGSEGIQLRHFFSRFCTAGVGNRPKYEVIGNHDASCGIYRANIKSESLKWGNHWGLYRSYHFIEDVYESLKERLESARVAVYGVSRDFCWWRIDSTKENVCWIAVTWIGTEYKASDEEEEITLSIQLPECWKSDAVVIELNSVMELLPPWEQDKSYGTDFILRHGKPSYSIVNNSINLVWTKGTICLLEAYKK